MHRQNNTIKVMIQNNQTQEALYNEALTSESLLQVETIDPAKLHVIRYSRPQDICEGREIKLANMCGGFPHQAIGHVWKGTEFLYLLGEWSLEGQEEIQKDVLSATSGYAAKRYKKNKHKREIRADFPSFRHQWMLWCIWQKCQNSVEFRNHLLSMPDDAIIVEVVKKDPVWAAEEDPETGVLTGCNAVGKILTICRLCLKKGTSPDIDTELLNRAGIYILGEKVQF